MIKSLVIETDGRMLVSADADGNLEYAPGYTPERVIEEMLIFGMECLGAVEQAAPEVPNRFGLYVQMHRAMLIQ